VSWLGFALIAVFVLLAALDFLFRRIYNATLEAFFAAFLILVACLGGLE
jgi:hypothetical protein